MFQKSIFLDIFRHSRTKIRQDTPENPLPDDVGEAAAVVVAVDRNHACKLKQDNRDFGKTVEWLARLGEDE